MVKLTGSMHLSDASSLPRFARYLIIHYVTRRRTSTLFHSFFPVTGHSRRSFDMSMRHFDF